MEIIVLVGILIAVFMGEILYYRLHALDNLSLKVDFSKNVADFGEKIELIEVVENRKKLPLPFIILKFETPREIKFFDEVNATTSDFIYREDMLTMKAFSKHTRRIKAKCSKRGYYVFPRVGITTSDLFLLERFTKEFDNDSHLIVLPERVRTNIIDVLVSVTLSEMLCRRTILTDPFSPSGIREYGPNDPMKSINWKASAKTGDLMVNQNASTCTQKVHIFLNLESYNPKGSTSLLEKAISLTYTYLIELEKLGIQSSMYTNGIDILTGLPVVSENDPGSPEKRGIMLAGIDLKTPVIPFAEIFEKYVSSTDQSDFIMIISPQFSDSFRMFLADIKTIRPSLLWLMPCYKSSPAVHPEPEIESSYLRWEEVGYD